MNKNFTNKLMAGAMASAGLMAPLSAFAVGQNYTPVAGGTTQFDKYLVMDSQAEVPNASFTYTITPGTAKTYDVDGKKFEVLAGLGTPTMAGVGTGAADNTIVFKQGDTITGTDAVVGTDQVKDLGVGQKYVKKTATLDFSGITFPEPGVYRYVVTEAGTNQGITNDADLTRTLDVYVIDNAGALEIAGYVLHASDSDLVMGDNAGTEDIGEAEKKSQGFTNVYDTSDLTFRKEVSGNQASKDKYFKFTVNITAAVAGTVYKVDISGADATSLSNAATVDANEGQTNVTSLTIGKDGTCTQDFYLQHGQEIKIQGLAKDTHYTVTEDKEDYKSTAAGVTGYEAATDGTIVSTDLKTSYLNTRNGVIPTGVIMTVAPFAVVTLLGGAGAAFVMNKKEDEE